VASATTACELTSWGNSDDLNALAAACAEVGDFDNAVRWQSKAIEHLSEEKPKADYRIRLTLYRQKKPYRESPRPKP
jgi:serine/threonine-protein kinase